MSVLARLFALWWREIADRRMLLVAAATLGLLPLALTLVPTANHDPQGTMEMTALLIANFFLVGSAVILGASILVSDWAEDRMGFYLSRPARTSEIWIAKISAALFLGLGGTILVLLPTVLAGGRPWETIQADFSVARSISRLTIPALWFEPAAGVNSWRDREGVVYPTELTPWLPLLLFVGFLLLGHAGAVLWRLRGLGTVIDMVIFLAVAALVGSAMERNEATGAEALEFDSWVFFGLLVFVFLALVGWLQLKLGGRVASRAHGVFTISALLILGSGALAMELASRQTEHIELGDLEELTHLLPDESGDWLFVGGVSPPRDTLSAFALHQPSGLTLPLGGLGQILHPPTVSADGRRLVWFRMPSHTKGTLRVFALDLGDAFEESADAAIPEPLELPIPIESSIPMRRLPGLSLDAAGERIAVWVGNFVRLHDFEDGRLLGTWVLEKGSFGPNLHFGTDGTLRASQIVASQNEDGRTDFTSTFFRLRAGQPPEVQCRFDGAIDLYEPKLDRILIYQPRMVGSRVFDLKCRERAEIPYSRAPRIRRFLRDGSLILGFGSGSEPIDLLHFPIGEPAENPPTRLLADSRVLMNLSAVGILGQESDDGKLLIGVRPKSAVSGQQRSIRAPEGRFDRRFLRVSTWITLELDIESGEIQRRFEGYIPLPHSTDLRADLPSSAPAEVPFWLLDSLGRPHHPPAEGSPDPRPVLENIW